MIFHQQKAAKINVNYPVCKICSINTQNLLMEDQIVIISIDIYYTYEYNQCVSESYMKK